MATRTKPAPRRARPSGGLRSYLGRANLMTSLVLILPLLVLYQLGVLVLPDVGNGADMLTGPVFRLLGASRLNFLFFNVGLLVLFAILTAWMRSRQQFDVRMFVPVVIESGVYALGMGTAIAYVMHLIGISPRLVVANAVGGAEPGVLARVALSLGAGVHEELVFRLAMIPAVAWVLVKGLNTSRWFALAAAFVVSSFLFSAAHHVIGGEPFHVGPFVYRFFCGMLFAALYQFRGLAVAVYTHALYDIYVMLFHP